MTKTVSCGAPGKAASVDLGADAGCQSVVNDCAGVPASAAGAVPAGATVTMTGTFRQQADRSWQLIAVNCISVSGPPVQLPVLARQAVLRLVPHPQIGHVPPDGTDLVNTQSILWANTGADRDLGTINLLGQPVALRVHLRSVVWDFGDHTRDTAATPGKAYDPNDPCKSKLCPDYYGHTYTATGTMTITATITWNGQYRVGAGAWQDIAGTVTGPTQATTVRILQARGMLVPVPGEN